MKETLPTLRKQITRILTRIAGLVMVGLLLLFIFFQLQGTHRSIRSNAQELFYQIEQILVENEEELRALREEYSTTILRRAESIAYILKDRPELRWDIDALSHIAEMEEVDEIHLFDKAGVIVSGTVPDYYGYSFDSGEQISFFKPLLEDKSLRLVQDITPNTAVGMPMQYSALWSADGEFIVQVGMQPTNVQKVTEKNELSYIFSLLRANPGVQLYAADPDSGEIRGATEAGAIGRTLAEIGIEDSALLKGAAGFHAVVNGEHCYCVFDLVDGNRVGYVVPEKTGRAEILLTTLMMAAGLALVAFLLVRGVTWYMQKYVIDSLQQVNDGLKDITRGKLDERLDIHSSLEFSELSEHINTMVQSLLAATRKIAFILDQTDLSIGVYEYSENMDRVRYTEHVPAVLDFPRLASESAEANLELFKTVIQSLRRHPLAGEENVYSFSTSTGTRYIRLEEICEHRETTGIVIDVTEEVLRRQEIEKQRDLDALTGVLNRRGLDNALAALFTEPEKVRHSAIVMVDADGLKSINDSFGHHNGDLYIRGIVDVLAEYCKGLSGQSLLSRNGGDEFVLFLYGYESDEALLKEIEALRREQDRHQVRVSEDTTAPLRFSMGCCLRTDAVSYYGDLFCEADKSMYADKRSRKEREIRQS